MEEGHPATLSAEAAARRNFTYQWHRDGRQLPGATAAHLRLTSAAVQEGGRYMCVAANRWGSAESQTAQLAVEEAGGPPFFTLHPRYVPQQQLRSALWQCLFILTCTTISFETVAGMRSSQRARRCS